MLSSIRQFDLPDPYFLLRDPLSQSPFFPLYGAYGGITTTTMMIVMDRSCMPIVIGGEELGRERHWSPFVASDFSNRHQCIELPRGLHDEFGGHWYVIELCIINDTEETVLRRLNDAMDALAADSKAREAVKA